LPLDVLLRLLDGRPLLQGLFLRLLLRPWLCLLHLRHLWILLSLVVLLHLLNDGSLLRRLLLLLHRFLLWHLRLPLLRDLRVLIPVLLHL